MKYINSAKLLYSSLIIPNPLDMRFNKESKFVLNIKDCYSNKCSNVFDTVA